jgi:predicted dithiol-disulfide oxidoreductase (DUF899 family)
MTLSQHTVRFPNESPTYRTARDRLLDAEMQLRHQMEEVAALRRQLPLGGMVRDDYRFDEADDPSDVASSRPVRLSDLFTPGKNTLVVYSFMYGPKMKSACPSCTSILDSLDGSAPHITQRVNLAVVARSPLRRIREFAGSRGWRHLHLLSSEGNSYNRDYHAENETGDQLPVLNVFVRTDDGIHHYYATELLYAPHEPGQDSRHVDGIWPLWNAFDYTPDGRGSYWQPKLQYDDVAVPLRRAPQSERAADASPAP